MELEMELYKQNRKQQNQSTAFHWKMLAEVRNPVFWVQISRILRKGLQVVRIGKVFSSSNVFDFLEVLLQLGEMLILLESACDSSWIGLQQVQHVQDHCVC